MICAKNVEDVFARANQIVGYDSPVAPPPNSFGAHDRRTPFMTKIAQLSQTFLEGNRFTNSAMERVEWPIVKNGCANVPPRHSCLTANYDGPA
jgi:hypothetical protein